VNIEKYGKHHQKKICNEVPVQKCVPVPVKVEGQKCVNVPTQSCETVPVVASVPVPQKQCYKKPRKVCQTLVTTKPKVVTEQVPQEVCGHSALKTQQGRKPKTQKKTVKQKPSPKKELSMFPGGLGPRLKHSESEKVPVFEEPTMGYKKEDIPLFEDASKSVNEYGEDDIDEDPFRGYGNNYLDHLEEENEEMQGYGSTMVQEEVEYDEYREREEARAAEEDTRPGGEICIKLRRSSTGDTVHVVTDDIATRRSSRPIKRRKFDDEVGEGAGDGGAEGGELPLVITMVAMHVALVCA